MKIVVAVFVCLTIIAKAQNCSLEKNEKDEFTGKIIKVAKEFNFANFKLSKYKGKFYREGDQIWLLIFFYGVTSGEFGCMSSDTGVYFKFKDEETAMLFPHAGKIDCSSQSFVLNVTDSYDKFKSLDATKMRLSYEKKNIDLVPNNEKIFSTMISCVLD